jgi:tetratricopeptide (TPR) repeat protein
MYRRRHRIVWWPPAWLRRSTLIAARATCQTGPAPSFGCHTQSLGAKVFDNRVVTDSATIVVQAGSVTNGIHIHAPRPNPVPHQLPSEPYGFTGRGAQLAALDSALEDLREPHEPGPVVILTLAGMGGVGKTALAVKWANSVRARFPDGQLYVDLSGFGPEPAATPADVLARFLQDLGVPGADIPLDEGARAALFRTVTDGCRMLLLLDNAGSAAQVRPLLPGSASCMVMVTSRDILSALVAKDGARRVDLDVLPAGEATTLLRGAIGDRVDAEPDAARAIINGCGQLPLALRLAAELMSSRPGESLADLAHEFADQRSRLDLLDAGGDLYTSIRAVFSWSYSQLPPAAARVFRLWSAHPGRDIDIRATAAVADLSVAEARQSVSLLLRAHLAVAYVPGRYVMHDLIAIYAAEMADLSPDGDAQTRLFNFYVAGARQATDVVAWHRRPAGLDDRTKALAWLDAEHRNLMAVATYAADHDLPAYLAELSTTLASYLDLRGNYADALTLHRAALLAAQRHDDRPRQGRAAHYLGRVHWILGQLTEALTEQQLASELLSETDSDVQRSDVLNSIGLIQLRLGNYPRSQEYLRSALTAATDAADRLAQARILSNLATVCTRMEFFAEAAENLRAASAIMGEIDEPMIEGNILNNLAFVHFMAGEFAEALDVSVRAVAFGRRFGHSSVLGYALKSLGAAQMHTASCDQALASLQESLTLAREIGNSSLEAEALIGIGQVARRLDMPSYAEESFNLALTIADKAGNQYEKAQALEGLADLSADHGRTDHARGHLHEARQIYIELQVSRADLVQARLESLCR